MQVERGSLCGMNGLPDDTAARHGFLQDWAAAQQQRLGLGRLPLRTRLTVARIRLADRLQRSATRVLDRGLDTAGSAGEPEHDHPDRIHYVPSAWHVLPRALRYIGVSDRDVFVDFGCGKGRVVHQAARRPFRRVVGVEISPVLAEVARSGLAARRHQHRCRDVEIVVADVTAFRVPDDLTVGFFYRPFMGETFETRPARHRRVDRPQPAACPADLRLAKRRRAFADSRHREISAPQGATKQASRYRYPQLPSHDLRESLNANASPVVRRRRGGSRAERPRVDPPRRARLRGRPPPRSPC